MPNVDGLEATRRLLARVDPPPRVLILTTFGLDEYVFGALRAGASVLLKDAPPEQLIAAVHTLARGDALLDPGITRAVVERFSGLPEPDAAHAAGLAELSDRRTARGPAAARRGPTLRALFRAKAGGPESLQAVRKVKRGSEPVLASELVTDEQPEFMLGLVRASGDGGPRRRVDDPLSPVTPAGRRDDGQTAVGKCMCPA